MPRCLECDSAFFKTLEIRVPLTTTDSGTTQKSVYFKKRCKRCKFKFFIEKKYPDRTTSYISYRLWKDAIRVATGYELNNGGFQIMVGEYTRRMSRNAESFSRYLKKLDREKRENPLDGLSESSVSVSPGLSKSNKNSADFQHCSQQNSKYY